MKTLLFTLEYPPFYGGVANYYGNLVKYWPQPGEIFVLDNSGNRLVKNWLLPKWLPAIRQLKKEIKKNKIDHVVAGNILPLGTAAYFLSKRMNFKYSVILHGMDFAFACRTPRKRWLTRKILKKAENVICANSYTAKLVGNFLGSKDRIIIVNPGIDNRITHNVERVTQIKEGYNLKGKLVLLTVGRLVKRKGIDMVLACLPEVLKQTPNLVYAVIGDGPEEKNFKKLVASLKLERNVLTIGNADDEERNAWLELSDIFIMPARKINDDFEGFGIVYLEANLAGKPVIAGDSGGVRDAVVDGLNGLMVNPENKEEITAAIIKLAKDENLREKLGRQGRERTMEGFSWKKQIEKIYNLINPAL
ncbi:MAG: glycosyltransferase family 4 protein [Patescibacteria group bacterium]|nr:glycosyltransferase family 4 protein [Patescibacteria group bacterium]MDD5294847.1 glycosyltransferase family 4 protein [Patescibacteria group bacterium]MDD5554853.1 glycosyltransferase family 4 protein [Patescibacteria group bacterium]